MRQLILLLPSTLLLSGCIGDLIEWGCFFSEDEEHCYQAAAVQESNPDDCAKVVTERFEHSNPPRDKCYLMIAENTGDITVCDDIEGGPASYTREGCIQNAMQHHGPESCADAQDETACRTAYALNGRTCGFGFTYDRTAVQCREEVEEPQAPEEEPTEQTDTLSNAEKADILTIADAAKGKYIELLEADIAAETDPGRLAGLQAYRDFLSQAGQTMEDAQASYETLSKFRQLFIDSYDPANDIQHFDVAAELDPGLFDAMRERLFGAGEPLTGIAKENAEAEHSLTIYQRMLEQQADNDFLKKDRIDRLSETIVSEFRDTVTGNVVDPATELAENLAGSAFFAVTYVGDALESFRAEAEHQMFLGLARAYNRRRDALQEQFPDRSPDELHQLAVQQVRDEPYRDNTNTGVVKHGNILANPNCSDGNNPLCIQDDVWWTAMDKTYRYNNR